MFEKAGINVWHTACMPPAAVQQIVRVIRFFFRVGVGF